MPLQVNLAPPEALQRVAALAEAPGASVTLAERGDAAPLPRHPTFRLLAAMNPATGPRAHNLQMWTDKRNFSNKLAWKIVIERVIMQSTWRRQQSNPPSLSLPGRCGCFGLSSRLNAAGGLSLRPLPRANHAESDTTSLRKLSPGRTQKPAATKKDIQG